jgi:hypothetical protein
MSTAYQSDESDDAYPDDATSGEHEHEEGEDNNEEEREGTERDPESDVDDDPSFEADDKEWQDQLQQGRRTRRKPPVNYNEEKVVPAETPTKVCRGLIKHFRSFSEVWSTNSAFHEDERRPGLC